MMWVVEAVLLVLAVTGFWRFFSGGKSFLFLLIGVLSTWAAIAVASRIGS